MKVENIHCRLEGCCAKKVLLLQEHRELPFATLRGGTEFTLPVVYEFTVVEVYIRIRKKSLALWSVKCVAAFFSGACGAG